MSTPSSQAVNEHIKTWLAQNTSHFSVEAETADYAVYLYHHPQTDGVIEVIATPDLTQNAPQVALTLPLALPPIQTVEDATMLLELAEWLTNVSLIIKESGSNLPALQLKLPLAAIQTPEDLTAPFNHLLKSKQFFEEE